MEIDWEAKAPITGVPRLTRICVDLDRAVNFPVAACSAVMVDVPTPTTFIVLPDIVATFVLDEVNVHGAGELVVGGTRGTVPTPYVTVIAGNGPKIVNVACAIAGTATTNTEITSEMIESERILCTFLDLTMTGEIGIFSLSSISKGYLGFHERGFCEICAKK